MCEREEKREERREERRRKRKEKREEGEGGGREVRIGVGVEDDNGIWVRKRNVIISLSQMAVFFVNAAAQERLARGGGAGLVKMCI